MALQFFDNSMLVDRVVPGRPDESGLLFRMRGRGAETQMPPLGTEVVDPAGMAAVEAWIDSL